MASDSSASNNITSSPSFRRLFCSESAPTIASATKLKPERLCKKRLKQKQIWSCMDVDLSNKEECIDTSNKDCFSPCRKNLIHSSKESLTDVSQNDEKYKYSANHCDSMKLANAIKPTDSPFIDYSDFSQNDTESSRLSHDDDHGEYIYHDLSDNSQNSENRKSIELPKCLERQRCVIFRSDAVDLMTESFQTATTSDLKSDKIGNLKETLRRNTSIPNSEEIRFLQLAIVAPVNNETNHKSNSTLTRTDRSPMQGGSGTQISNTTGFMNSDDRPNQELGPPPNDDSHYNRFSLNTEGHNSNDSNACTDVSEIQNEFKFPEPTDAKQHPDLSSEGGVKFHNKQIRHSGMRKTKVPCHDEEDSATLLQVLSDTLHVPAENIYQYPTELKSLCYNTENTVQETNQDQEHLSLQGACGGDPFFVGYGTQETQIVDAEIEEDGVGDTAQETSQNQAVQQSSRTTSQTPPEETTHLQNRRQDVFPDPAVDDSDLQRFEPLMAIIDKIAVGERVPPQITMRYEMLRLCTLRSFPKENKPFIIRIAQAGFYYANSGDEVVCYYCAKRKSGWRETDIPLDVHRQLNPNCRFLMSNSGVNVSVRRQETLASRRSVSAARVASALDDTEISANSDREQNSTRSVFRRSAAQFGNATTSQNSSQALTSLVAAPGQPSTVSHPYSTSTSGLTSTVHTTTTTTAHYNSQATPVRSPKYPAYVTFGTRQASFRDCSELVVPADTLAEAGFFYAGFGDCCRCFQCGVGLRHWSAEDDSWIEHSRWSRNCSYVREKKGEEFINLVQMAVEYQQNEQRSQEQQLSAASRSGERAGSPNVNVDSLLHTDAAQSVLEMGYGPEMIRTAIQVVLDTGFTPSSINAALLMEKIFALEESNSSQASAPLTPTTKESLALAPTPGASASLAPTSQPSASKPPHNQSERNQVTVTQSGTCQNADGVTSPELEGATAAPFVHASRKMPSVEQKKLREENARMKQQTICTKCKQNDVSIVFLPCGHLVTCEQCAETVRYCTERNCGKYIKGTVRTYAV